MPDYDAESLINVPYIRVVDRSELKTCFEFPKGGIVWLPNEEIQDVRDFEQEVRIPKWLAEEKGLI